VRTALVVVDMLNDFIDGVFAKPAASEIVEPIAARPGLLYQRGDWLVVHANGAHRLYDVELRSFLPHASARWLAEEARAAFEDIDEVVATCERAGLARGVARLRPLGVVKG